MTIDEWARRAAFLLGCLCASCGYTALKPRPPAGVGSVSVPEAVNASDVPSLGFLVTAELRRCLAAGGSPRLAVSTDPDAPRLLVRIRKASSAPSSYRLNAGDQVAPGDQALSVQAEAVVRRPDGADLWGPAEFAVQSHWPERDAIASAQESEERGASKVASDLADRVCRALHGE